MAAFDQRGQNVSGSQVNVAGRTVVDKYTWVRGSDAMGTTRALVYGGYDALVRRLRKGDEGDTFSVEYAVTKGGELICKGICHSLSAGMNIVEEVLNYTDM